jgi:hypothetical protein
LSWAITLGNFRLRFSRLSSQTRALTAHSL